jgi:hypothetical protein
MEEALRQLQDHLNTSSHELKEKVKVSDAIT